MRYLALSAIAVLVILTPALNAFAQTTAGPALSMYPTIVKQGDKALIVVYGYPVNTQLNIKIVGYGSFPPITTDATGHAVMPVTIPNMLAGSYTMQVSDSGGHVTQVTFGVSNSANTPSPLYGEGVFSHFLIPKYAQQSASLSSNLILEAKNIFVNPITISIIANDVGITSKNLATGIVLQPGQSYVYSGGPAFTSSVPVTMLYQLKITTTYGSAFTDSISVTQFPNYPIGGDVAQYPETYNTLASLGAYVPFTVPPSSTVCPSTAHIDPNTGHCIDNVTGGCVDCSPIASIQLSEQNSLTSGTAGTTVFHFNAKGLDATGQPVKTGGTLYLFANGNLISNATMDLTTGTAAFAATFSSPGTYNIQSANNPTDGTPVNSNIISELITSGGSGGGSVIDINALYLGIPLWFWIILVLAIIAALIIYSRKGKKKRVRISMRRR